ncbi:MAG: hypothetical protein ACE5JG_06560, partial [Planctomycetota bacterium]
PRGARGMRLQLASLLIQARRPARALAHLRRLEDPELKGSHRDLKSRLEADARALLGEGGLELAD